MGFCSKKLPSWFECVERRCEVHLEIIEVILGRTNLIKDVMDPV
jgi:hypothetical protein